VYVSQPNPAPAFFLPSPRACFLYQVKEFLRLTIHDMHTESRSRRKQEGSRRRQAGRRRGEGVAEGRKERLEEVSDIACLLFILIKK
jgi:hypothetical protein